MGVQEDRLKETGKKRRDDNRNTGTGEGGGGGVKDKMKRERDTEALIHISAPTWVQH